MDVGAAYIIQSFSTMTHQYPVRSKGVHHPSPLASYFSYPMSSEVIFHSKENSWCLHSCHHHQRRNNAGPDAPELNLTIHRPSTSNPLPCPFQSRKESANRSRTLREGLSWRSNQAAGRDPIGSPAWLRSRSK